MNEMLLWVEGGSELIDGVDVFLFDLGEDVFDFVVDEGVFWQAFLEVFL